MARKGEYEEVFKAKPVTCKAAKAAYVGTEQYKAYLAIVEEWKQNKGKNQRPRLAV